MEHGDFTELAENYVKYRPAYSPFVRDVLMGLLPVRAKAADVGAGTGIWTNMLASAGCQVEAVEPNCAMRRAGEAKYPALKWHGAAAEETGLPKYSCDLVTMASSFHWVDFDLAVREFGRVLKPGGYFCALWNTREVAGNAFLEEIEARLKDLVPNLKRISSGRSEFTEGLEKRLRNCRVFEDVVYLEGRHVERQSPEHYIGLWESVNDVRVQAGPERFGRFIEYIRERTKNLDHIDAGYITRAWVARKG